MSGLFLQVRGIVTSKLTRDTSVVLLGNVISSGFAVVFTILAARLLGPESWGIVAAIGSLITILVAFGDLGFTAALFRFVSKKWLSGATVEVAKTIKTVWTLRVLTALFLAFIIFIFSGVLSPILLKTPSPLFIMLTSVGLIGALFVDFQIAASEAKQEWKKAAVFISLTNILRVSFLFLVGFNNLDLFSIALIFSASSFVAYLLSLFWQRTPIGFVPGWQKIVKELIPFSGAMGVNRIISSLASRIDVLLLIQLAGAYDAGIYGAANRLAIGVPIVLASFATVIAPSFASLSKPELPHFFKKSMGLSLVITLGLVLGIFIAPLVVSLFGPEYEKSSIVLQLLFLSFIPASISVPAVNFVIYAMHKPQTITLLTIIQLPLIVFLNIWLVPKVGVVGPAIALAAANTLTAIVTFVISWLFLVRKP